MQCCKECTAVIGPISIVVSTGSSSSRGSSSSSSSSRSSSWHMPTSVQVIVCFVF